MPNPFLIAVVGLSIVSIATGVGLLRLSGWARVAAGALACLSLSLYATTLVAVLLGDRPSVDWLGLVGSLVIVFAIARRWPATAR